jgi:hypothetical protein
VRARGRTLVIATVVLALVPAAARADSTWVLYSDPDAWLGAFTHHRVDDTNSVVYAQREEDGLIVDFVGPSGGEDWTISLYPPLAKELVPGTYSDVADDSSRTSDRAGMSVGGNGRAGLGRGTFEIKDLAWGSDGKVARLWAVFVHQHPFGPAVFGEVRVGMTRPSGALQTTPTHVRWPSHDFGRIPTTVPVRVAGAGGASASLVGRDPGAFEIVGNHCAGVQAPCDVDVAYRPPAPGTHLAALRLTAGEATREVPLEGHTHGGRTRLVLEGDPGDWVSQGKRYEYDASNAWTSLGSDAEEVGFGIDGALGDWWSGRFAARPGEPLRAGTDYLDAKRTPYRGDAPGVDVLGNGRGCNEVAGSFRVDELDLDTRGGPVGGVVRFAQHCDGATPAFRGVLEVRAGDTVPPPPWGLSYVRGGRLEGSPALPGTDPASDPGSQPMPGTDPGSDPTPNPDADPTPPGSGSEASVRLTPSAASRRAARRRVRASVRYRGPSSPLTVALRARARLGSYEGRVRAYRVDVKQACGRRTTAWLTRGRRGQLLRLRLESPTAWCRGRVTGSIRYVDAPACRIVGTCETSAVKTLSRRVGHVAFRVR